MTNLDSVLSQLRRERDLLNHAISALEGISSNGGPRVKRHLSAAGRARIAAAQRKRWAKVKARNKR